MGGTKSTIFLDIVFPARVITITMAMSMAKDSDAALGQCSSGGP
jgi:hypothetical protein